MVNRNMGKNTSHFANMNGLLASYARIRQEVIAKRDEHAIPPAILCVHGAGAAESRQVLAHEELEAVLALDALFDQELIDQELEDANTWCTDISALCLLSSGGYSARIDGCDPVLQHV